MNDPGPKMSSWFHWLESLATPGGLIFLTLTLFLIGCLMMVCKWPYGETVAHDSFVALMTASGSHALARSVAPPA